MILKILIGIFVYLLGYMNSLYFCHNYAKNPLQSFLFSFATGVIAGLGIVYLIKY